ncbi:RNA polymerase II subunit A C-terminal domain phosphatase SSU72 [Vairimorpha necatrix]|uniref:RNA polymerase II subunit A C-terminal domain phosphatase SSU72 n=1 Tax=Vairimorpha necatrix TaxID=6039 RepID=A0AAX4JB85_9MICR
MKIAVCCAMNQNRSMEAHKVLQNSGYEIDSYGTNNQIKIPGETLETPNIYKFGTSYREIYEDLHNKNAPFYEKIGILKMLERNMKIKNYAENFFEKNVHHDLIITAEEKCFVAIYENKIKNSGNIKTFLINFDIKDTISDASSGALEIKDFIDMCMINTGSIESRLMKALESFNRKYMKNNIFTILEE